MLDRSIWEAQPRETCIYRMDSRTKIVVLASTAVMSVLLDSPQTLFLILGGTLCLHFVARSTLAQWRVLLLFLLFSMWGTMVSQALFYNQEPRTEIFCLITPQTPLLGNLTGGLYLYKEGLLYGAIQAIRAGITLSVGLLMCWNTDISRLMRVMVHWRMPYEVAFMLTTSIRFIPVVFSEATIVLTAQRLKGFSPAKNCSPIRFMRTAFQTLLPIIARIIRRTELLALSVECRGFSRERQGALGVRWPIKERLASAILGVALMAVLLCKIAYSLQYNGVYYLSCMHNVYSITSLWM